ncbi:hypothetical protein [Rivularia sp. PCC 7116]|uniref:hypothetical protein n=1 Tax=Rivularia sp. PCC 7116 TaxID=373994 RepID=UPI000305EC55|nr:hypothetical protein [Rivularia sp. PCC 7116]
MKSAIYKEYLTRINQIENQNIPLEQLRFSVDLSLDIVSNENWIPTLRNPEELYLAYSGKEDKLTAIARNHAINDLKYLNIIPNLNQNNFNAYVGIKLLEKPIIQKIDKFVQVPQRFGVVRDFLASLLSANLPNLNPERAWQSLMRWLLYFLPSRYALSVPNYSEVFYRIK